jgi:hypothetical protein
MVFVVHISALDVLNLKLVNDWAVGLIRACGNESFVDEDPFLLFWRGFLLSSKSELVITSD